MAERRRRWSRPAAEAAAVMLALGLAFAAGATGFVVGRETADGDAEAAAETQAGATGDAGAETETAAAETETAPTEAAETATGETETDAGAGGETETAGTATGGEAEAEGAAAGRAVFAEAGCGSCHAFEPAGSSGNVGPSLDRTTMNKNQIERQVRRGGAGMPPFEGRLSDAEIEQVSEFVAAGARG